jgi:hypothetical protein
MSRLVSDFCQMVLEDEDTSSRFHMAAHELAENLSKYSTGSPVSLEVQLMDVGEECMMKVCAHNQTSAEKLQEVEERLVALQDAENPIQHYDRLIRETAAVPDISGLGLARIRAEGDLDVEYTIAGNELTISVCAPVTPRRGA